MRKHRLSGFTLIELSIVLVIIGLIVGGVLVGQDLIKASEVRAQIAQIEKYNTAANTFRAKYNFLPGDANATTATQFGLLARAGSTGRGDGNGIVEGWWYQGVEMFGWEAFGEPGFFWSDLANQKLVDGSFSSIIDGYPSAAITNIAAYIPPSKAGTGYVSVYSYEQVNYFSIFNMALINVNGNYCTTADCSVGTTPSLTVSQAYNIDKKTDDGLPTRGTVQANYNYGCCRDTAIRALPNSSADTSGTCYNTATSTPAYSISYNNGKGVNCALSFKFQ